MAVDLDVELATERLLLRPLRETDSQRLAEVADDVRIARNLTHVFPHPYAVSDAEGFIGSNPDALAIELVGDGLIGVVGGSVNQAEDPGVFTFGYWIGVDYWGHGYVTEAARAFVDHLRATGGLRRIEAAVYAWNPASCRVLEKLGFDHEGTLKARVCRFGEVTDEHMYGLVV